MCTWVLLSWNWIETFNSYIAYEIQIVLRFEIHENRLRVVGFSETFTKWRLRQNEFDKTGKTRPTRRRFSVNVSGQFSLVNVMFYCTRACVFRHRVCTGPPVTVRVTTPPPVVRQRLRVRVNAHVGRFSRSIRERSF